jgi:hypothetical protein
MVELEDREVEEEDVSPEDWFLELQPEQRARARKLFNGKSPISEILAGRVSLSSDTASSVTAQTNNSEKLWFKKRIREVVYPYYKFLCLKNRKYNGRFCQDVFGAIGRKKAESEWDALYRKSEAAINEIRAGDANRIKESFDGKWSLSLDTEIVYDLIQRCPFRSSTRRPPRVPLQNK